MFYAVYKTVDYVFGRKPRQKNVSDEKFMEKIYDPFFQENNFN